MKLCARGGIGDENNNGGFGVAGEGSCGVPGREGGLVFHRHEHEPCPAGDGILPCGQKCGK